ncbi:hypothetical protein [Kitasatospora sp. NPDC058478]|uniref:hypothetical protein n=1 Tax=unclassified Kitasatospora TaxID=2633591 RepID=UPI00365589E2
MLVIDDSGDRKAGTATSHVGRQWPGRYGKTYNGIATVTTKPAVSSPRLTTVRAIRRTSRARSTRRPVCRRRPRPA